MTGIDWDLYGELKRSAGEAGLTMKSSQHPSGTVVLTVDYPAITVGYIFYTNGKTTVQTDD